MGGFVKPVEGDGLGNGLVVVVGDSNLTAFI
jgi:hypothetical protein